ncbi:uncharacterized protein [Branchiostoma lanceolatum]|uniref:uncharacterized protein n=1 Tax=Branchiostoma lanceolatum TaxID=7740 RepID=UPI0034521F10
MSLFVRVWFTFGAVMAAVSLVSRYEEGYMTADLCHLWGFNTTCTGHVNTTARETSCSRNHAGLSPAKVPPGSVKVSSEENDESVNLTSPFEDDSASEAAPLQDKDRDSSDRLDERANLTNPSQDGDKTAADEAPNVLPPSPDEPLSLETILNLKDNGHPLPADLEDDVPSQGTRIILSPLPPSDSVGGWRTNENDVMMYAIRHCDFDVRYADQMTSEEFESTYRNRKPLLLRFRGGARDWTHLGVWTRDELVSRHGKRQVRTGYPSDTNENGGLGDDSERLDAYLTRYLDDKDGFDFKYVTDRTLMTELAPLIRLPPYLNHSRFEKPGYLLLLGRSRTGLSWHAHKEAWNGVVFGAKRWFVSTPNRRPPGMADFEQLDWMKYVHPYVRAPWRPLECLQQAGDVVYVPEDFYHAVLNIGDTVAASFYDRSRSGQMSALGVEFGRLLQYAEPMTEGAVPAELERELNARFEQVFGKMKALSRNISMVQEMHELVGWYQLQQQRPREAIATFQAAIRADPFHLKAYTFLAHAHSTLRQHDKAEEAYLSALYLHRTSHHVWLAYAGFLEQRGNLTAAEQAYKKALFARPSWPWLYQELARVQAKLGKEDDLQDTFNIYRYLQQQT